VKGKPWTIEEEKQLKQMLQAGKSVRAIAKALGKSRDCIRMKIARLEVVVQPSARTTTTLPVELPSVEEALKLLAGAMIALKTPGLDQAETLRLRSLIQAASMYQMKLAEYIDYRGIEAKLIDLEAKYEKLLKKKTKDNASKPNSASLVSAPAK
jgi:hypothetical protein